MSLNKQLASLRNILNLKGVDGSPRISSVAMTAFITILILDIGLIALLQKTRIPGSTLAGIFIIFLLTALYVLFSLKIANQWEEAVLLRFGKFHSLKGPGLFWAIPIIDDITNWIDLRVMVTPFSAENTLTKDKVQISVEAVLFWVVWDSEKAALEIEDYSEALKSASQTGLREVINGLELEEILVGWAKMDPVLQKTIDKRSNGWGVTVQSVEIRNIDIPRELGDMLTHQAQAELERRAKGELESQAQAELERQARSELERQAELERERQAEAEQERKTKLDLQRQAQAELERQTKLELERLAEKASNQKAPKKKAAKKKVTKKKAAKKKVTKKK